MSSVAPAPRPDAGVDAVVQAALSLRGTRYRLGGQDPRGGLDCSGLVRYVFNQQQLLLPRTVGEQFGAGHPVDFDRIQAGDVLFFATTPAGLESGTATHVGIALGAPGLGEFVHAPGSGGIGPSRSLRRAVLARPVGWRAQNVLAAHPSEDGALAPQ